MAQLDVNSMKKNTKGSKSKNSEDTAQATQQTAEEPQENVDDTTENPDVEGAENNSEIDESSNDEPVVTADESAESTDNASEKTEDTDKTTEEPQEKAKSGTVVVTYVGGGTYRDNKHECWANEDKSDMIKKSRVYSKEEYENRKDLKFMVEYGSMTAVVTE